jgi:hypothetical protein
MTLVMIIVNGDDNNQGDDAGEDAGDEDGDDYNEDAGDDNYYYADHVNPDWAKDTATTKWVQTAKIEDHIFGNVVSKPKKKK